MADGGDNIDETTSRVLEDSAALIDESRRLLRRLDHLLDAPAHGDDDQPPAP